ncbi:MAG: ankyrin repeat domain-containing protein [Ekhidna sp.]|nr:ankyrin repeat domain-containing protein [Ekhidna sp.]
MKNITRYFALIFGAVLIQTLISCGKDDATLPPNPTIINFTPENGAMGTTVNITGTNFSTVPSENTVTFHDGRQAIVTDVTATVLTVTVPDEAETGIITVSVNEQSITSKNDFTVTPVSPPSSPCPDAAPTPIITYSSDEKTLFDSMATAIRAKHLPELKRLIACNAAKANTTGPTVLQSPVLSWLSGLTDPDFDFSIKAAEVLIDNGADIEKTGLFDYTPLWYAALHNNLPLVKFLVAKGAKQKTEAMITVASRGHSEVLKFLLSEGADIFAQAGAFTENILMSAANAGQLDVVKFLVEEDKRLDMHLVGFDGSALTRAARRGHVEVVKYLLDKGVDINQSSKTALQLAAFHGHLAVVEELIRRGSDVNKADVYGYTPLMVAIFADQNGLEIVKALVEQGKADLTKMNSDGKTALAVARETQSRPRTSSATIQKMIDYLVSKNAPE